MISFEDCVEVPEHKPLPLLRLSVSSCSLSLSELTHIDIDCSPLKLPLMLLWPALLLINARYTCSEWANYSKNSSYCSKNMLKKASCAYYSKTYADILGAGLLAAAWLLHSRCWWIWWLTWWQYCSEGLTVVLILKWCQHGGYLSLL